ncbi:hypothetical protein CEXT_571141 [Caerostris extrusa]|uniref:Transposase n=1 Tax=Caerostris extrusa TaxID=172846 RepID=A0AAV4RPV2_CAEEX|nr:hypothetical protein CEXT_571141 [Caerostris extrusa]
MHLEQKEEPNPVITDSWPGYKSFRTHSNFSRRSIMACLKGVGKKIKGIDQQVKKWLLPRALLSPFTYDGWDVYLNLHGRRSPRMGIICSDDFYQRRAYLI